MIQHEHGLISLVRKITFGENYHLKAQEHSCWPPRINNQIRGNVPESIMTNCFLESCGLSFESICFLSESFYFLSALSLSNDGMSEKNGMKGVTRGP